MIVYNSMIFVVLVLMVIYQNRQPDVLIRETQPIPWAYAIISMGYIVFWAGLRSGFADTRAYIFNFENQSPGVSNAITALKADTKGPAWECLTILFKYFISDDFHWWLAAIAILSGLPIMLTFRKKSVDYLFSMYLFITSTTFSWMLNGIRQFFVAAILFGFYFLIIEKKRLLFIGIVLICSLIHTSAIIVLPAIFLVDYRPFGKMMSIFVCCILLASFFISPVVDTMEVVLQGSNYHDNLDQFAEDDGANPLRVAFESIPVVLAFLKRKEIAEQNNRFINLCINMSTIAAGLFVIAMFTSGIMIGRLPIYFGLYNFVLIPYLINFVYTRHRRLLYWGFFISYLVFYFFSTTHFYYISDILGNYF